MATLDSQYARAQQFAKSNGLSFFTRKDNLPLDPSSVLSEVSTPLILLYHGASVSIIQTEKGAPGPVSASFLEGKAEHRRKFGGGKGQLIAKAVGLKSGVVPEILDVTAGLGRDAFVLASLGCKVRMLEQSPVIAELLSSALDFARSSHVDEIISRMTFEEAEATHWLDRHSDKVADVIYLDPMYPHREKSSLVKKEMRLFKLLIDSDQNDDALLKAALEKARYRVVVKRPRKGIMIKGPAPSYQLSGKSSRYDIYTLKSLDGLKSN